MSYTHYMLTNKDRVLSIRVDAKTSAGLELIRERYGTPISEQVRRALIAWLTAQGALRATRERSATGRPERPRRGRSQ
jgi:hypothetical protein